jgi:hypothetical protein
MATRRGPAPKPPSLKPEQAIPILEDLIRKAEAQVRPERYDSPVRNEWAHTGEGALIAGLGSDDPAIHAFGGAQCGSYGPYDTDARLQKQANQQLDGMLSILRSAVEQLRWKLPDPRQVFVPSGSPHDAYVQIRSIIQQATTEVLIIDPWVDETLWPLLTNIPGSCKVRVLGEHLKGDFKLEAARFAAQHGTSIEVRTTTKYHDRFIFLDGKRCFHLGASIKDAGKKSFALSEFERPQLITGTLADAEAEWAGATPVAI